MLPQIIKENTDRETREALETIQEELPQEFLIIRRELEYLYKLKQQLTEARP